MPCLTLSQRTIDVHVRVDICHLASLHEKFVAMRVVFLRESSSQKLHSPLDAKSPVPRRRTPRSYMSDLVSVLRMSTPCHCSSDNSVDILNETHATVHAPLACDFVQLLRLRTCLYRCCFLACSPAHDVLLACLNRSHGSSNPSCSFTFTITFVFLNLFIGVILDGFNSAQEETAEYIKEEDFKKFAERWAIYDPHATCLISVQVICLLLVVTLLLCLL